ncbi:MAG: stage V sporulation protein AD [Lachnospiraceae bacterium]
MILGKASIKFDEAPYIQSYASVVGKKEGEGPLGAVFDEVVEDPMFGGENWEDAEGRLQAKIAQNAMKKGEFTPENIRYIYAGDLLGQLIATFFGLKDMNIPLFGLYGACSTMGEALSLGAMSVAGGFSDCTMCLTSSHFASAEKTFRFPLGYGTQRKFSATWTVTGGGGVILGKKSSKARITGITTGKIVDYGIKDKENMGACMAPAAADTIYQHFCDFSSKPKDYDKIITGDLGYIGQTILIDLLEEKGCDIKYNHMDCGIEIFNKDAQDTHAGASGCGCSASVLCSLILGQITKGAWKKVLFVPTGALFSPVTANEGNSIPGIAHAVVIEHS